MTVQYLTEEDQQAMARTVAVMRSYDQKLGVFGCLELKITCAGESQEKVTESIKLVLEHVNTYYKDKSFKSIERGDQKHKLELDYTESSDGPIFKELHNLIRRLETKFIDSVLILQAKPDHPHSYAFRIGVQMLGCVLEGMILYDGPAPADFDPVKYKEKHKRFFSVHT